MNPWYGSHNQYDMSSRGLGLAKQSWSHESTLRYLRDSGVKRCDVEQDLIESAQGNERLARRNWGHAYMLWAELRAKSAKRQLPF